MTELLDELRVAFPELAFTAGARFVWSPETGEVFYRGGKTPGTKHEARQGATQVRRERDAWSLLHETGHALLGHKNYNADVELLQMELAAWQKARELAKRFNIVIDADYVEDCLDTYRDWLHRRSICPTCTTRCLQASNPRLYRCHNCHTTWKVTPSRFCRPYRSRLAIN